MTASLAPKLAALMAARVVPVLRYTDAATAAYAAEVAVAAGCTTLELTWTIPGVTDLLRALRDKHGTALQLGVGTVLDEQQAREALVAGADFLVSPALATEIVDMAHAADALCLLGAFTPTEVLAARRAGADIVKIFPADTGGPKHLAAIKSVYPDTLLCPTGGVTQENMGAYFAAGAALVGIGSNLYDKAAFAARDTPALVAQIVRTREAAHG
ncbi:bifunctional 4-hydroxy-2-oxoglutarate aldolase/2-dehydro-3-deoxy-phosphogluconate aldolase [Achromobacter denitrificans]|jgi:2-dehydro-3-deoxyphosphogluconate aldolase/(4S)-4-hydroxy-2-oxoglutarate aldolase|uniref:bifunctional 4-hydroxy-2-oxoglutarate aldolase/2-dehydro-3-deoxy-phosphogluconate aldolase n=1 Tax=Achromobacter denitrificans TaxID=32002 RepID=UPI000788CF7A|nr:bifunctional 4-hydroxy-2-oxoglutarate aldolase/2-dehydro-3-deoxy-phosphogluconate aldolase [Achromobacter denitrificans]MDX3879091.1 bifunctional 4-hydroxy-2-oxoglutarate aldolase/2-dehydro-3-deoxy-phosphogluconate aldolase [Achromobacter sp.]ASC63813.1 2-dehydro-3-deoxyphosphogluconate aldolase [Achromobacter denitrificans]MBV2160377.1 bifunctional 4-hydroxy-2-oxoglutarate aldolase/2-dehydro-3-deoxy-phosphogluconate aldolase [Achromobacter denitrificans]MDF3851953.1 bifunctional 4-hydroxy-2